jgi:hypothetical protein
MWCVRAAEEAVFLTSRGQSPYQGDVFHGAPLLLPFASVLAWLNPVLRTACFALMDVAIAVALRALTRAHLQRIKARDWSAETLGDVAAIM